MEGHFVEEDVLYRRTFCIGGRFLEGRFVEGRYVEGRFVGRTFCSEGRFMEGRFVVVPSNSLKFLTLLICALQLSINQPSTGTFVCMFRRTVNIYRLM